MFKTILVRMFAYAAILFPSHRKTCVRTFWRLRNKGKNVNDVFVPK